MFFADRRIVAVNICRRVDQVRVVPVPLRDRILAPEIAVTGCRPISLLSIRPRGGRPAVAAERTADVPGKRTPSLLMVIFTVRSGVFLVTSLISGPVSTPPCRTQLRVLTDQLGIKRENSALRRVTPDKPHVTRPRSPQREP